MSEQSSVLGIDAILRILPQRPPAVLVDRVVELEPGVRIVTAKNMTSSERFFEGHFPHLPVLPPSVLLETMVQSCSLLAYATEPFDPAVKIISLVGVNKTKFHRMVIPGDVLEVEVESPRKRSNVWRFGVTAYVEDHNVADSEVVISIRDRDDVI